jgi:hypothetical protein
MNVFSRSAGGGGAACKSLTRPIVRGLDQA